MTQQRKRKLSDTHHRTRMRVSGYEDGLRGFPPRHPEDPTYMTSHRRGRERAADLREQEER